MINVSSLIVLSYPLGVPSGKPQLWLLDSGQRSEDPQRKYNARICEQSSQRPLVRYLEDQWIGLPCPALPIQFKDVQLVTSMSEYLPGSLVVWRATKLERCPRLPVIDKPTMPFVFIIVRGVFCAIVANGTIQLVK